MIHLIWYHTDVSGASSTRAFIRLFSQPHSVFYSGNSPVKNGNKHTHSAPSSLLLYHVILRGVYSCFVQDDMLRCKSCLFTTTLKPPRPLQIEIISILISSRDRFTSVIDSDLENIRMGLKCLFGSVFIVFIVTLN